MVHAEIGRLTWNNRYEFLLAILGYIVGVGNVVRFPYLIVKHKGAFVIAYLIFLFFMAIPLMITEFVLGQYGGLSVYHTFKTIPLFQGMGLSMGMLSCVLSINFGLILGYALFFLVSSFTNQLPWMSCKNTWNDQDACYLSQSNMSVTNSTDRSSSTEQFWYKQVLMLTDNVGVWGKLNWLLTIAVVVGWIVMFLSLYKSIKSIGKIAYVTALLPYIILIAMMIYGFTLDNSWQGIKEYFHLNQTELFTPEIWVRAGTQVCFSLGPGWGAMVTMASYNKFNTNVIRYGLLLCLTCACSSLLISITLFAWIGHFEDRTEGQLVLSGGTGQIFSTYPEIMTVAPQPTAWSILFFFLVILIAIDSQLVGIETFLTIVFDQMHTQLGNHKKIFTGAICIMGTLLSSCLTFGNGYYLFNLIDWYGSAIAVTLITLFECIFIHCIGYRKFMGMINEMQIKLNRISKALLFAAVFITAPCCCLFVSIGFMVTFSYPDPINKNDWPEYSKIIGWSLTAIPLLPIPIGAIVALLQYKGKLREVIQPTNILFDSGHQRAQLDLMSESEYTQPVEIYEEIARL